MTSLDSGMFSTRALDPPLPAERARSIAERGEPELLCSEHPPGLGDARVAPLLHHITEPGEPMLLLPADHPVSIRAGQSRSPLPVMLELTDIPSVPLIEPIRGLVWVIGWLHRLDRRAAQRMADEMAAATPDPTLLDVNHGLAVLRMTVGMVTLVDGEGTAPVSAGDFAASAPDPFCRVEAVWLHHLEKHHPHLLTRLLRHAPVTSRRTAGEVRTLGLDRYGMRLRLRHNEENTDVRVPFTRPASCPHELNRQLRGLAGTPFPESPIA